MAGRSRWFYLLPIIFGILGGIAGYLILRKDDPDLGRNVFLVGLAIFFIPLILGVTYDLATIQEQPLSIVVPFSFFGN